MSIQKSYSWEIHPGNVATKRMDSTVFVGSQTGVPKDILHFFDLHNVSKNKITPAYLHFGNAIYKAKFKWTNGRMRLHWGPDFAKKICALYPNFFSMAKNGEDLPEGMPHIKFCPLTHRAFEYHISFVGSALFDFDKEVAEALNSTTIQEFKTEVEHVVRFRVGQQKYRAEMLHYWGGACSVTGITLTDVLVASHAKPWAMCCSDNERLDVFNGFLLNPSLDALFDRFLITFDEDGNILVSNKINNDDLTILGVSKNMKLRWKTEFHERYLRYHREEFNCRERKL